MAPIQITPLINFKQSEGRFSLESPKLFLAELRAISLACQRTINMQLIL